MAEPDRAGPGPSSFAEVFRQAIDRKGVTLVWLCDRLAETGNPVSMATLSYWRSGQRRPEGAASRAALAVLEELLDLDRGGLAGLLTRSRRIGPSDAPVLAASDAYDLRAINETIDNLGRDLLDGLRDRSIHVSVDVDERGHQRRVTMRSLTQAQHAGVSRYLVVTFAPGPKAVAPCYTGLHGCRVGRTYSHPSGTVFGAVLVLDRVLDAGQTTMLEIQVDLPPGFDTGTFYQQTVLRQSREVVIWVRFDPSRPPAWFEESTVTAGVEDSVVHQDGLGTSVVLSRRGFGPGEARISWGFTGDELPGRR